ncbi:MAG: hypothetical protein ACTFAK_10275 [Candidatus Electronema sp. VV]
MKEHALSCVNVPELLENFGLTVIIDIAKRLDKAFLPLSGGEKKQTVPALLRSCRQFSLFFRNRHDIFRFSHPETKMRSGAVRRNSAWFCAPTARLRGQAADQPPLTEVHRGRTDTA